jgi:DNA mismatch repair protein MutL
MGFRGEALASIAAVSQFELKTRQAHSDLGTHLLVDASEVKSQGPVACEKGTSISVKNLFLIFLRAEIF